jgi:transposase
VALAIVYIARADIVIFAFSILFACLINPIVRFLQRSYCGLCGAESSSADIIKRTPLSKQRNKHLQAVLIEAAKMAPRNSPALAMVYEQEKQKGNANRATLAVVRKMVAYLVAVDRRQKGFLVVENKNRTAA